MRRLVAALQQQLRQLEARLDLVGGHRALGVLLVGEEEERRARDLGVRHQRLQHAARLVEALGLRRVDDVHQPVRLGVVLLPDRAQPGLPAQVPEEHLPPLDLHPPDVEADRRRDLARRQRLHPGEDALELLEQRRLSCAVEPEDEDVELDLAEEGLPKTV